MFGEAAPAHILYPMFALVFLVVLVFLRLRSMRFAAVRRSEVSVAYYRAFTGDEEPEELRVVTRNFINLFEVPILFYVVSLMIYVTHQVTYVMVALAWLYVALRYAHTFVHLTKNDVIARFSLYLASGVTLSAMWAILLVRLLTAA